MRAGPRLPIDPGYSLLLQGELLGVWRVLEAEKIRGVVLKGMPLAHRLGVAPSSRRACDNDILVRRADAARTVRALEGAGYVRRPMPSLPWLLENDFQVVLTRYVGGIPLVVDLHWAPFYPTLHNVPERIIWQHVEPLRLRGTTVRVFDKPLTLLHLAAHYEQHAFCEPRILRDLARAWNVWSAEIDVAALVSLAEELGLQHALDFALQSAAGLGWLDAKPPAIGSRRAARLRRLLSPAELATPRRAGDYARTLGAAVLLDPHRVPRMFLAAVFPPPNRLAAIHDEPVGPKLILRYLARPIELGLRALGRARRC